MTDILERLKRWPIIRHIRAIHLMWQIERHYATWQQLGSIPWHRSRDEEYTRRIWRGEA